MLRVNPATLNGSQTKFFIRGHNATLDSSPSNKTITNTNGVTVVDAPGGHPGSKALEFVGSSSQKLTSAAVEFNQLAECTIDFYHTHTSASVGLVMASQDYTDTSKNGRWTIVINDPSAGYIHIHTYDGVSNYQHFSGGTFAVGSTYHVAFLLKAGTMWLHINGVPITSLGSFKKMGTGGAVTIGHDGVNNYLTDKNSAFRLTAYARWAPGKAFIPPVHY